MTQREPTSRVVALCLDANDPQRMAKFWTEALGWEIGESDGETALIPTDDIGFVILLEPTSDKKVGQNNIHLDLTTTSIDDQQDTVDRLIKAGARHVDIGQRGDEGHVVLADPETSSPAARVSERSTATARTRSASSGATFSGGR